LISETSWAESRRPPVGLAPPEPPMAATANADIDPSGRAIACRAQLCSTAATPHWHYQRALRIVWPHVSHGSTAQGLQGRRFR
jgi:hypothetical protein